MGSGIINAGHNGLWVRQLVLLKQTVQPLLKNVLVRDVRNVLGASQDFVCVSSSVEASLVVLSGFPIVVEVSEPFVNFEVVESDVGDDLLLDGGGVSSGSDAVLEAEALELLVSVKAFLHRFGNLVSKSFDQINELNEVSD